MSTGGLSPSLAPFPLSLPPYISGSPRAGPCRGPSARGLCPAEAAGLGYAAPQSLHRSRGLTGGGWGPSLACGRQRSSEPGAAAWRQGSPGPPAVVFSAPVSQHLRLCPAGSLGGAARCCRPRWQPCPARLRRRWPPGQPPAHTMLAPPVVVGSRWRT